MNQDMLTKTLISLYTNEKVTVLVDGSWGIGKTYAWEEVSRELKTFVCIRVSMFGIDSLEAFKREVKSQYIM